MNKIQDDPRCIVNEKSPYPILAAVWKLEKVGFKVERCQQDGTTIIMVKKKTRCIIASEPRTNKASIVSHKKKGTII